MRGDGSRGAGTSWASTVRPEDIDPRYLAELAEVMPAVRLELGDRASWLERIDPVGFQPRWLRLALPRLVESAPAPWWLARDLLHRLPADSVGEVPTFHPPGPYRITVDCTGGAAPHRQLHLGTATRDDDGVTACEGRGLEGPDREARRGAGRSHTSTRARCHLCGRDERRRDWWAGCDWLAALGVEAVDLGALGS